ncbi:MAG: methyltransferase domain-containing protein [Pirellulaceae bacterium]|nr:methyltransferase domain-containing protein [Pirellulaceae bacterium]
MPEQDKFLVDPFDFLADMFQRPPLFGEYTVDRLWQDEHISQRMLELHLDKDTELASRPHAFIERSAEWIKSRFEIGAKTVVFDYGCGPGLYTSRFARMGASVTGIDFSKRSIDHATAYASDHSLEVSYVLADYLSWETTDRADLITLIFCDLCPLSPHRRQTLFGRFRRHLKPGGHILLDVCSLAQFESKKEQTVCERNLLGGFFSPHDYFGFLTAFKYDSERVSLDKYTIVERGGVRHFYNWIQHYGVDELAGELGENGFAVQEVYSNVAGDPYEADSPVLAVVAQVV